ncbi:DUF4253 domain-containing protein [Streptomyces phyllanthi]|uniref:DUF4253 domain-containing protein n=1 Tax=Streptomyces phyllanthi TaxID=1803180 RepID=A0A5N8WHU7_9ACTN|nr:DUF4253 domain-containing protein [Streptomyces phyllanthi]MPY46799.1 DUF4253 domain-containing protein [Streptomyces phyllanthi]
MTDHQPLPAELSRLLPAGGADGRTLSVRLPSGHLLSPPPPERGRWGRQLFGSGKGGAAPPVMWVSDGSAPPGLWEALHNERARSGLTPLLLLPLEAGAAFRPWESRELYPQRMSSPDEHDAAALLRLWWERVAVSHEDDPPEDVEELRAVTAPFGPTWPGLASPPASDGTRADPDTSACEYAARLLRDRPEARLGLVAAESGAAALVTCGWAGPTNHTTDTGQIAAVLHSWGQRFGTRVVGVGFDTLYASVATPPTTMDQALLLAAEHFAFCPDNVRQGSGTLAAYAEEGLVGDGAQDGWCFWWD